MSDDAKRGSTSIANTDINPTTEIAVNPTKDIDTTVKIAHPQEVAQEKERHVAHQQ